MERVLKTSVHQLACDLSQDFPMQTVGHCALQTVGHCALQTVGHYALQTVSLQEVINTYNAPLFLLYL